MPFNGNTRDLEKWKFTETDTNDTAVRVVPVSGPNDALNVNVVNLQAQLGVDFDSVVANYPTDSIEIYTYSLNSVDQFTITVVYTDLTKERVDRVSYNAV